jgi:lipopolysaccharide/colanic/teichoic acid biosynthesis glycosyltransferase
MPPPCNSHNLISDSKPRRTRLREFFRADYVRVDKHLLAMYQKVVDGYIHRYLTKPGITGWAQVNGYRGETDRIEKMESRVAYDLYYVKNWSFALDMRIVAATILQGFKNINAY